MALSNQRHKIENRPRDYIDALRGRLPTATDTEKARLHAEIAERYDRRYAWDVEQRRKPLDDGPRRILPIRLRQMERLFAKRWSAELPNNRDGWHALVDTAHTIAGLGGEVEAHIVAWAAVWASWVSTARAEQLAAHIAANPIKFTADTLGWRLKLTPDERAELQITTIGAIGQNKADRAAERRRKHRERQRARRAAESTGKPRGRPRKNACAAGSTVKIDTPYGAHGISPTTVAERGTAADKPATGGTRLPGAPSQPRQSQPKTIAKGKTAQAGTPAHHQDASECSKPQAIPCDTMIRLDWAPPANYGRAFDPTSPPAWAKPKHALAVAIAAGDAPSWVLPMLRSSSRKAA